MHQGFFGNIWDAITTTWDFWTKAGWDVNANIRDRIEAQSTDAIKIAGGGEEALTQLHNDLAALGRLQADDSGPFNYVLVSGLILALILILVVWKEK